MHAFQARCNHSHICCLLRRAVVATGAINPRPCFGYLWLLGLELVWQKKKKKGLKHTMGIFYTITQQSGCVGPLRSGLICRAYAPV